MGFLKGTAPGNARWRHVRRGDDHFQVLRPDGTVYGDYPTLNQAAATVGIRQKETDAAARKMTRACMCCRRPFDSEGIHNRLCDGCRRLGDGPIPCGVATSSRGARKVAR